MDDRTRSGLLATECAFPCILRTLVAILLGFLTGCGQRMVAVEQKLTSNIRHNIGKEGQHENFGIVEDVTTIPKARESLGGNAVAAIVHRGVDTQLIDVVAYS